MGKHGKNNERDEEMDKFSNIQYERPDMESFKAAVKTFVEEFPKADSYETAKALFLSLTGQKII